MSPPQKVWSVPGVIHTTAPHASNQWRLVISTLSWPSEGYEESDIVPLVAANI